jgi:hypothetical protein
VEFEEGYDGSVWQFYGDPGIVVRAGGPASGAARHLSAHYPLTRDIDLLGDRRRPQRLWCVWRYNELKSDSLVQSFAPHLLSGDAIRQDLDKAFRQAR